VYREAVGAIRQVFAVALQYPQRQNTNLLLFNKLFEFGRSQIFPTYLHDIQSSFYFWGIPKNARFIPSIIFIPSGIQTAFCSKMSANIPNPYRNTRNAAQKAQPVLPL
jgi:hypothetical protein